MRKLQHYGKPCGYMEVWRSKPDPLTETTRPISASILANFLSVNKHSKTLETVAIWRIYEKPKSLQF